MRKLEIAVTDALNGGTDVRFKIVKQTHRNLDFSPNTPGTSNTQFQASNGWILTSFAYPDIDKATKDFFVRGRFGSQDDDALELPWTTYQEVAAAVNEYNKIHRGLVNISKYTGIFAGAHKKSGGTVKKIPSLVPPPLVRKKPSPSRKRTSGWDKNFIL